MVARGLNCATCHQEHQGVNFNLNKISNEQCRSCHVVKFDSFDGHHPKFENYPFKRRTRIVYDHAGHFGKHFPEVAKKYPARRIPATCSTCHNSRDDKRIMAVAPFEQTCTACHLDQIIGKERASGPKGIAFLTLPGLDLQSLKEKNASIGEWPDASEAALTPFMKVMISRNERGRALIKTVDSLNLQDLTDASDDQIKAVTNLVWEIKGLFYALISGKASDVLGDLNIGGGAKLSANLVADLTASIPRDVVISAQQQWLPNLATEMANRPTRVIRKKRLEHGGYGIGVTPVRMRRIGVSRRSRLVRMASAGSPEVPAHEADGQRNSRQSQTRSASLHRARSWSVSAVQGTGGEAEVAKAKAAKPEGAAGKTDTANAKPDGGKETPLRRRTASRRCRAGLKERRAKQFEPEGAAGKTDTANAKPDGGKETLSADKQPQTKAADQSDDLLFPTEDELREIKAAEQAARETSGA